jgi:hypothetical protein
VIRPGWRLPVQAQRNHFVRWRFFKLNLRPAQLGAHIGNPSGRKRGGAQSSGHHAVAQRTRHGALFRFHGVVNSHYQRDDAGPEQQVDLRFSRQVGTGERDFSKPFREMSTRRLPSNPSTGKCCAAGARNRREGRVALSKVIQMTF